ncbi:hypothetical protein C8T65DRAFT_108930 [Cerioporus squamosus]|nr:hypothetical protein C8T65DRAFT_108930 [Cerioporus squamosus]
MLYRGRDENMVAGMRERPWAPELLSHLRARCLVSLRLRTFAQEALSEPHMPWIDGTLRLLSRPGGSFPNLQTIIFDIQPLSLPRDRDDSLRQKVREVAQKLVAFWHPYRRPDIVFQVAYAHDMVSFHTVPLSRVYPRCADVVVLSKLFTVRALLKLNCDPLISQTISGREASARWGALYEPDNRTALSEVRYLTVPVLSALSITTSSVSDARGV